MTKNCNRGEITVVHRLSSRSTGKSKVQRMREDKKKSIGYTEVEVKEYSLGLNSCFIEKHFCWLEVKKAKAKTQKYREKGENGVEIVICDASRQCD